MGQHTLMNVGEDTTLGDCDVPEKLVQLLIIANGELEMAGNDTSLLVVTSGVASQLKNFGSEVLEDGSEVDGGAGTDTLGIVALAQETMDTTNGERETSLGRTAVVDRSAMDASLRRGFKETNGNATGWIGLVKRKCGKGNSRLCVLGAARLATGLSAASHFDGFVWGW
jgi:hypothetical protein